MKGNIMKVLHLLIQNIKKIQTVSITPEGNIVEITGKNAQGKSAVIDAIMYALGGKETIPDEVINNSKDYAKITVDLGEYTAIREFWRTDNGYKQQLQLQANNNTYHKSPQHTLDKIFSSLTFDPLAFERMKPIEQYQVLAKLVNFDESEYNGEIERLMAVRRDIGRDLNALKAKLNVPIPEDWYHLPDEKYSILEATKEFEVENEKAKAKGNLEREILRKKEEINTAQSAIEKADTRIRELHEEISRIERRKNELLSIIEVNTADIHTLTLKNNAIIVKDADTIRKNILQLEMINKQIEEKVEYYKMENRMQDLKTDYDNYTSLIEEVRERKRQRIRELEMPLPELRLTEDNIVTYNNIPFASCSQAERLLASLAIAEKLSTGLRVALIRDGSLIDTDNMKLLHQWAVKNDFQVWIEVVESNNPDAIVIEEGFIKSL